MNDKVSVQVVTFGAMNFAMQQNYVPLVRSVTIKNNSDEEIKDIMLKISFEPEFAKPFTHRIEVLPPHTEIEVSPIMINDNGLVNILPINAGTLSCTSASDLASSPSAIDPRTSPSTRGSRGTSNCFIT